MLHLSINQNCTRQTPDFANFYYIIMALEEETKQVKAGGPIPIPVRTNFCFGIDLRLPRLSRLSCLD